jgi:hypothetical protein
MKKLDIKVIIVTVFLLIIALISFKYWEYVSKFLMNVLNSKYMTVGGWVLLMITAFIHYYKNKDERKNVISDKEGLDKPIDYFMFFFTFGAIGTSIQVLAREVFAYYSFPDQCRIDSLKRFDIVSFIIVIIVLVFYCYNKIKPVLQETYIKKNKIQTQKQDQ